MRPPRISTASRSGCSPRSPTRRTSPAWSLRRFSPGDRSTENVRRLMKEPKMQTTHAGRRPLDQRAPRFSTTSPSSCRLIIRASHQRDDPTRTTDPARTGLRRGAGGLKMAEREGFEPSRPLRAYGISSAAPSTELGDPSPQQIVPNIVTTSPGLGGTRLTRPEIYFWQPPAARCTTPSG